MTKNQAVQYFGNQAEIARALGISSASISKWGEQIPKLRAYQLQTITDGALKTDDSYLQNTSIKGLMKNDHTITD